jgi:hypothetical protein
MATCSMHDEHLIWVIQEPAPDVIVNARSGAGRGKASATKCLTARVQSSPGCGYLSARDSIYDATPDLLRSYS